mgnify:CR=1 FL=1
MEKIEQKYSKSNNGNPKIKEEIILKYLPLVKYVVNRLPLNNLPGISKDDLISSGIIGLIKASDNFDSTRGVKFKTYAILRIKGAIIDELRSLEWIPRSLLKKANFLEETYISLKKELGRRPKNKEIAKRMGITERSLHYIQLNKTYFFPLSLDNTFADEDKKSLIEKIPSSGMDNPLKILEKKEIRRYLKKVIQNLPERERTIIILYYYEELTLKEIGKILGLSESRISQIHSKTILSLRSKLKVKINEIR